MSVPLVFGLKNVFAGDKKQFKNVFLIEIYELQIIFCVVCGPVKICQENVISLGIGLEANVKQAVACCLSKQMFVTLTGNASNDGQADYLFITWGINSLVSGMCGCYQICLILVFDILYNHFRCICSQFNITGHYW